MVERMAVAVTKAAFSGSTNVCEDERRSGLGGESVKIDAVPSGDGGGEDAGRRVNVGPGVVTDTETVTVMGTTVVLGGGAGSARVLK